MSAECVEAAGDAPAFGIHDGARIVECSPDLAEMFGYDSPDEAVGKEALHFIDERYRDQSTKEVLASGGGPYASVGLRLDGVRFRIEISAFQVRYRRSECRLFLVRDLSPRALIVDDNNIVRNMTALLFRKLGYSAVTADSAENAVRAFRKGSFAVVLTDVVMPQVDGVELAARLRAMDSTLPILLMSGYSDVQIPLDEYSRLMKKPFGIEDLSRGLASLPERARAGLM